MRRPRVLLAALIAGFPVLSLAAQLLVLNKNDHTLSFIDLESGQTSATIATGEGPHEMELSADGAVAFVSNYGAQNPGNSLSIIDVKARKESKRVDLGELRRPHGLTMLNGQLYLTAEQSRSVARFDPGAQRVDWTFETGQEGTHMVLAARDGKKLFTTNMASNTVSVIERGAGEEWRQTLINVGQGPEALDQSPDGRELWVAHTRDGAISIIDVASGKVTQTVEAKTKRSNRLKFTPDGRSVLVTDLTAGELLIFDARKRTERARLTVGRIPTGILIPADGLQAYVAVSGENRIAVVDLTTMSIARTIATGNSPDGMALVR